jgi:hypothetical protein
MQQIDLCLWVRETLGRPPLFIWLTNSKEEVGHHHSRARAALPFSASCPAEDCCKGQRPTLPSRSRSTHCHEPYRPAEACTWEWPALQINPRRPSPDPRAAGSRLDSAQAVAARCRCSTPLAPPSSPSHRIDAPPWSAASQQHHRRTPRPAHRDGATASPSSDPLRLRRVGVLPPPLEHVAAAARGTDTSQTYL